MGRVLGGTGDLQPADQANIMTTTDMTTICPFCGMEHECATAALDRPVSPDDGDATLCFRCGAVSIFAEECEGGLRKPTKKEQRELNADKIVQGLITAWKITRRQ